MLTRALWSLRCEDSPGPIKVSPFRCFVAFHSWYFSYSKGYLGDVEFRTCHGGAMALMIWRVVVQHTPVVVVKADEDQKDRLSRCGNYLMQALGC